jgi:hypothetical protein
MNLKASPNPSNTKSSIDYSVDVPSQIKIVAYDLNGRIVNVLVDQKMDRGVYRTDFDMSNLAQGVYMIVAYKNGVAKQSTKVVKN